MDGGVWGKRWWIAGEISEETTSLQTSDGDDWLETQGFVLDLITGMPPVPECKIC